MSTRQKRREKIEAEILEASADLLTEHGMEGLTVSKIAKAIDYTPGALYRYFPSKDAIITELHRAFITQLEALLRADLDERFGRFEPGAQRSLAALVSASETYLSFSLEYPARFRLFALGLADPRILVGPMHAQAALPAYLSLYATVSALFVEARQTGVLRSDVDPASATIAFVLALQGPLQAAKLEAHAPSGFIDTVGIARSVTDTLLLGWGAKAQGLAEVRRRMGG